MKLLICVAAVEDINVYLAHFSVTLTPHASLKFIHSATILHHQVDIVETGYGAFQTSYKITKALGLVKYHLALKIGLGAAYKPEIAIGKTVNIVNEKPGDFGSIQNTEWIDLYDSSLLSRHAEPHIRNGFINLTNAYMNVFAPFKKVVGVTVNNYADVNTYQLRREKYKADCETSDGLAFVYACLYEHQSFYQLCVIEQNLETHETNKPHALTAMNETLIDLTTKL